MKLTKKCISKLLLLPIFMLLFASCDETLKYDEIEIKKPTIADFSPRSGNAGTKVTIDGMDLKYVKKVYLNNLEIESYSVVSNTKITVVIPDNATSGKFKVTNSLGSAETAIDFQVSYAVPTLTKYPTSGLIGTTVEIEGTYLTHVSRVFFGNTEAGISYVSSIGDAMAVTVPQPAAGEPSNVDIFLEYYDGTAFLKVGTTGAPFTFIKHTPIVTSVPNQGTVGSPLDFVGTNLDLVEKVLFGTYEAEITSQTPTGLTVKVPTDFQNTTTTTLKLIHDTDKEVLVSSDFTVSPGGYVFWENKEIFANDKTTTQNFFDALTGNIYTPCDYDAKKNDIFLLMSIVSGGMRISNPNNSANTTKGFYCNDMPLPSEKMPRNVRLRRLLPSIAAENAVIENVKNKTLTNLSVQYLIDAGIAVESPYTSSASSGVCDYRGVAIDPVATNFYEKGSVILMMEKGIQNQDSNNAVETVRVGLIHITDIKTTNATSDKKSSIVFNCYYQK